MKLTSDNKLEQHPTTNAGNIPGILSGNLKFFFIRLNIILLNYVIIPIL